MLCFTYFVHCLIQVTSPLHLLSSVETSHIEDVTQNVIEPSTSHFRLAEARRRRKNAMSAKRSQAKRRIRRITIEDEKKDLELRNVQLCQKVALLENKIETLKSIYINAIKNNHCKCSKNYT